MPKCEICGRPKSYIRLNKIIGRKVLVECVLCRADYMICDIPIHIPKSQIDRYIDAKV